MGGKKNRVNKRRQWKYAVRGPLVNAQAISKVVECSGYSYLATHAQGQVVKGK
jgi:hypothetical protein